ncbi:MAG: sulfurtransferase [Acetobacteraceae bacterium]
MDPLVSTDWLAAQLGRPDIVVFDATKYLPNEGKDGAAEFQATHIPGAAFFDIDLVADQETTLPHMVPTAGRFERLMGAMGVGNDSAVVFYDQKGLASASRGWWLMGLFGHDQAAVLDGGLPKWVRERRPTENGMPPPPAPSHFRATFRAARLRGIGDMMAEVAGRVVLDARPAGRFRGTAQEPRPGLPSGHMPGSHNLPFGELIGPDGTMLPPDRLRERFAAAGVAADTPVVTSCGTGVTATILTLGLVRAGLPAGAVYDGSWTEWASRPDTTKATG